jgi:hypothetical protein
MSTAAKWQALIGAIDRLPERPSATGSGAAREHRAITIVLKRPDYPATHGFQTSKDSPPP